MRRALFPVTPPIFLSLSRRPAQQFLYGEGQDALVYVSSQLQPLPPDGARFWGGKSAPVVRERTSYVKAEKGGRKGETYVASVRNNERKHKQHRHAQTTHLCTLRSASSPSLVESAVEVAKYKTARTKVRRRPCDRSFTLSVRSTS
ncbi:hypothetical protein MRX96_059324 [Rhipicephalus microplus]